MKVNNKTNLVNISRIPPPIPSRPSVSVLAKSKHHRNTRSFAQATKGVRRMESSNYSRDK